MGNLVGEPDQRATDHQPANRDRPQLTADLALPPAQQSRAAMVLREASWHDTGARASRAEDGTGQASPPPRPGSPHNRGTHA